MILYSIINTEEKTVAFWSEDDSAAYCELLDVDLESTNLKMLIDDYLEEDAE